MYHFIYPSTDAYIYELNTNSEKNFGGDNNLVLKKEFDGRSLKGVSRILLNFDLSELSQSIVSGEISSGAKYHLRLYDQKTSELSPTYSLATFPLSSNWVGGTGYTTQDPNSRNGVSWVRSDESFDSTNWVLNGIVQNSSSLNFASGYNQYLDLMVNIGAGYADAVYPSGFPIGSTPRTISTWIKPTEVSTNINRGIFTYGSVNGSFSLLQYGTYIKLSTYSQTFTFEDASLTANEWEHVAVTYDGITGIKFYINGVHKGSGTTSGVLDTRLANNEQNPYYTTIGAVNYIGTLSGHFTGSIDEVALFNEDKSSKIEDIYNDGKPTDLSGESGLVGYWRFEGNVNDLSSNSNNGTIYGPSGSGDAPYSQSFSDAGIVAESGNRSVVGGGVWYVNSGECSQSFSYESPDVNMDVTDIVNNWLDGTISNNGLILKWSGSQENSISHSGDINFFSSDANSIYSPKLEVRWDDVDIDSPNKYSIDFGKIHSTTHVDVGDKQLISTEGTVACWGQITSSAGYRYFMSKYDTNQYEWYLTVQNNDKLGWIVASGSTHSNSGYSGWGDTALSPSTWYHIVGTFKFGEKTKIYLDGVLDGTANTALPSGDSLDDGTANILFSAYTQNGSVNTTGGVRLNDVSIFNKQLSSTEVKTLYNSGVPHDLSNESNLVGYWKFNEGSGTDLADSSTNNNTGTLKNSPTWISGSTDSPDSGSFGINAGTGTKDFYIYMRGLRETYRETETPKFRVEVRERYITKSAFTSKKSIIPYNIRYKKGWYSIVDVETGATLIPFGDNSKLSQDTTSNYFKLNFKGFITNRLYRILIRIQLDDERYRIFDDNFNFKVVS